MFGRKRKPSDFNAEVEAHLELEADRLKEQGLSDEEARMAARRTFGNVTGAQERFYESGRWVWWDQLRQDIRHGLRMLARNPGFTAVAVATLALGIGANSAIFSVVDSFLLRPLPVADPGQITIFDCPQKEGFALPLFSIPDYRDLREETTNVFSGIFSYLTRFDGLSVNGKAERIRTNYISGNFFSTLGVKPAHGRFILPSEGETPGADPVMVLSYTYWKERFGGDPEIVGAKVSVDGHPVTIVGVAPEGFYGMNLLSAPQAYLPLGMAVYGGPAADFITNRAARIVFVGARLQPGESLQQAQALLDSVARRLSQQYSDTDKDLTVKVYPELRARPIPQAGSLVVVLSGLFLGLTAIVLVLGCVNVANILLVRSTAREREMATRAALGAPRSRLVRQLLTESVLLALAGGVAGILFGYWGTHALGSIDLHANLSLQVGLDWRVLAYSLGIAILTGLVVGVVPVLRAASGDLNAILRGGGRGVVGTPQRLRTPLVGTSGRLAHVAYYRRTFRPQPRRCTTNQPRFQSEPCPQSEHGPEGDRVYNGAEPRVLQDSHGARPRAARRLIGQHRPCRSHGLRLQRRHAGDRWVPAAAGPAGTERVVQRDLSRLFPDDAHPYGAWSHVHRRRR